MANTCTTIAEYGAHIHHRSCTNNVLSDSLCSVDLNQKRIRVIDNELCNQQQVEFAD